MHRRTRFPLKLEIVSTKRLRDHLKTYLEDGVRSKCCDNYLFCYSVPIDFLIEKKNQNIIGASQWQKQFCLLCRTITTDSQELIETRQVPFSIRLIWVRSSTIVALTNVLTLIQKSLNTCLLWRKRLLGYTYFLYYTISYILY